MNKKKKIAVISSQYFWLPQEAGPTRFYSIAEALGRHQFEVDVVTSSFEHHLKKQRDQTLHCPFRVIYLQCPGYQKNISLAREISNRVFAVKVADYLRTTKKDYDAVYCSMPPNNISAVVGKICAQKGIPFLVDIEDLWPEAMQRVFRLPFVSGFMFYPYRKAAGKTYSYADGAVGTSDEYTDRARQAKKAGILCRTVYVGCDVAEFDREAAQNLHRVKKNQNEFWVTYAGTIGHSYAIWNLVKLAVILEKKKHVNIKVKIVGTGPLLPKMKHLAKRAGCGNIEFLGYLEHPLMAAYLLRSDILVNSFAKGVPQSIVNKIGDYLSAAKPMINTLENSEFCSLISRYRAGISIGAENPWKLYQAVLKLYNNPGMCRQLSANARHLAEEKFDRKYTYPDIASLVEQCIRQKQQKSTAMGE